MGKGTGSAEPERTPTWAIVPPTRIDLSERGSVAKPPTSTTRSTPSLGGLVQRPAIPVGVFAIVETRHRGRGCVRVRVSHCC